MVEMKLDTLPRTVLTRFLQEECHATMTDLIQGINTPTTGGTDHTPIMAPNMRDVSGGHSPTPIPTMMETSVLEGILPLPATTAVCATLQPMDAPITPHTLTPTIIVTLHSTLATSPACLTHTTSETGAGLPPTTPTKQHKDHCQEKLSNAPEPQHPTAP